MFKWFGRLVDSNEKALERLQPLVDEINGLEPEFQKLSDVELRDKTTEFRKHLAEQTVEVNQRLAEARKDLADAKERLNSAEDEQQCQEESEKVKALEDKVVGIEKEKWGDESDALDELLPEAFAAVREAARRTIGQRHYDVQLIGGIVLHQGKIAEMRTGEGKTLVATLPLYLNALAGKGCHLVTVNDYLARRDPYWMGPIYHALGLTVASIYPQQSQEDFTPSRQFDPAFDSGEKLWTHFRSITRQQAYKADITYGTSAEFGFDYLRDNMAVDLSKCVQRLPLNYCIADEVDNLLIDEARTPLIISGPAPKTEALYQYFAKVAERLKLGTDYEKKEKERIVELTESGYEKVENIVKREGIVKGGSLYDRENIKFMHQLRNALTAKEFYKLEQQYTVHGDEVVIVDEFTGHLMIGRRYSEGLHQAIEAKEIEAHNLEKIQDETKTYATVTVQNYFRMYSKLGGMTGTAATEAEEFHKIYDLEVVAIPPNKPVIREDFPDRIYKDQATKFKAVVNEVVEIHKQHRPILIGTVSIEKSESLSHDLMIQGIAHNVLNAKRHENEAYVIAEAGKPGAVTVATNMAGRGVDIILGGSKPKPPEKSETNDESALKDWEKRNSDFHKILEDWERRHQEVLAAGGLHVIGTERHESRRIDNQLRGRSGRQGDPGSTRFYVSLDDDIVRRFGGDRIKGIMEWAGMDENMAIENKMVNRTIEGAQVRVEGYNFDIRKSLVEYDDVTNQQREIIYAQRRKILEGVELKTNILSTIKHEIDKVVSAFDLLKKTVPNLIVEEEFVVDSQNNSVDLTDKGLERLEGVLEKDGILMSRDLRDPTYWLGRLVNSALRAYLTLNVANDGDGLKSEIQFLFKLPSNFSFNDLDLLQIDTVGDKLFEIAANIYEQKEREYGPDLMRVIEQNVMINLIDRPWLDHLNRMEEMRLQAGWEQLRQIKAIDAYKSRGLAEFVELRENIGEDIARTILNVTVTRQEQVPAAPASPMTKVLPGGGTGQTELEKTGGNKHIGRNDPCHCGSGKKYKHCHGK